MSMTQATTAQYPDLFTWRKSRGLTQTDAAKLLGITQARYSVIERGLAINLLSAKPIAEATGVAVETLLGVR